MTPSTSEGAGSILNLREGTSVRNEGMFTSLGARVRRPDERVAVSGAEYFCVAIVSIQEFG
jgi:hypothetical protein